MLDNLPGISTSRGKVQGGFLPHKREGKEIRQGNRYMSQPGKYPLRKEIGGGGKNPDLAEGDVVIRLL